MKPDEFDLADLVAAATAKRLCSAAFVSKRDPEEAFVNSVWIETALERPEYAVDYQSRTVTITLGDAIRKARFYGDQGCTIIPQGANDVYFDPVPVETRLPDPMTQVWPMGDAASARPVPAEVNPSKINAALDTAFSNPNDKTAAFLLVYKGQIIGERYADGINKDTQLESWSMGKSLTATLIGILVKDGHFDPHSPAPVAAWRKADDPRSEITIAHLLRMSSGLQFTREEAPHLVLSDHGYIYAAAIDVFDYSINKPLEYEPNTVGRYRNCDPLSLGYIIKQTVESRGDQYFTFPQRALFDRIGIRKMVLEADPYGNFIMTGYDYGTARNWARLGLLYLQDGVWEGDRILPPGWVDFVSTPAPAWDQGEYGGQFWVNTQGEDGLPTDAYSARGVDGQRTFIVPSYDLVIVRMGHRLGGATYDQNLTQANRQIIEAIR